MNRGLNKTPLLIQEGWLRHQKKAAQPTLAPQTEWSGMPKRFVVPDHSVRSIKGGFAASLLMSRPPLLCQEGSLLPLTSIGTARF